MGTLKGRVSRVTLGPVAAIVIGMVLVPAIAFAAPGSFSSSTATSALSASNSSNGRAVNAVSNSGSSGVFTRNNATGVTPALQAIEKSNYPGAAAVYGFAAASNGATYGVYGRTNSPQGVGVYGLAGAQYQGGYGVYGRSTGGAPGNSGRGVFGQADHGYGVYGQSPDFGVYGTVTGSGGSTGVWGNVGGYQNYAVRGTASGPNSFGVIGEAPVSGSYGVYSVSPLGVEQHVVGGDNFAGTCIVAGGTSQAHCTYIEAFSGLDVTTTRVVVTPTSNPGAFYWVSNQTLTAFDLLLGAPTGSDVVFNYVVVGCCL